jgi:hypothetical protein
MKTEKTLLVYYLLIVVALANLILAIIDTNFPAFSGWLVVIIEAIVIIGFFKNTRK